MSIARQYIHYDPERTDYSVTDAELQKLGNASKNLWKDLCLVFFSLGIPQTINFVSSVSQQKEFLLTLGIFLNAVIGGLGIALGISFGIAWRKTRTNINDVMNNIKEKPKVEIIPRERNIGSL